MWNLAGRIKRCGLLKPPQLAFFRGKCTNCGNPFFCTEYRLLTGNRGGAGPANGFTLEQRTMVRENRPRGALSCAPAFDSRDYWKTTVGKCRTRHIYRPRALGHCANFGEAAPLGREWDEALGIERARPSSLGGPRRADRSKARPDGDPAKAARIATTSWARESPEKAAGPLFRAFGHVPPAGPGTAGQSRTRLRALAVRPRLGFLRRDGQWPTATASTSTDSVRSNPFWERGPEGTERSDLSPSRRSDSPPAPVLEGHPGPCGRRKPGNGGFRDRIACAASRVRRHLRPLSRRATACCSATWARNPAVPALALRQPRQASTASSSPRRPVAITSATKHHGGPPRACARQEPLACVIRRPLMPMRSVMFCRRTSRSSRPEERIRGTSSTGRPLAAADVRNDILLQITAARTFLDWTGRYIMSTGRRKRCHHPRFSGTRTLGRRRLAGPPRPGE